MTEFQKLEADEETAELVGIILGDGSLQRHTKGKGVSTNYVGITLNSGEIKLIERTETLLESKFSKEPSIYEKEGNAVRVAMAGKEIVKSLEEVGLETGSKKKNQVGVPEWIFKRGKYCKSCLRGLVDTDGSIYLDKRESNEYTRISFKNESMNLLDDFMELCSVLGLETYRGGYHQVQVSRNSIYEFVDRVRPIKADSVNIT